MRFVKNSVKKQANFNINDLDIVKFAQKCSMPIVLITSHSDTFVNERHVELLYDNYQGEKYIRYE